MDIQQKLVIMEFSRVFRARGMELLTRNRSCRYNGIKEKANGARPGADLDSQQTGHSADLHQQPTAAYSCQIGQIQREKAAELAKARDQVIGTFHFPGLLKQRNLF